MVKVECILRPNKIGELKDAMQALGMHGMTVTEVIGCGLQMGHTEDRWNTELNINLIPKIKVEMVVADSMADDVVKTIIKIAKTGEIGDGKIFTSPITNAIRIRTEETGEDAI